MVKIKLSPSRKQYMKGKHVYDYLRAHWPVPKKFLKKLEPYFKEGFQAEISEDSTKIAVTYTFFKKESQPQVQVTDH